MSSNQHTTNDLMQIGEIVVLVAAVDGMPVGKEGAGHTGARDNMLFDRVSLSATVGADIGPHAGRPARAQVEATQEKREGMGQ